MIFSMGHHPLLLVLLLRLVTVLAVLRESSDFEELDDVLPAGFMEVKCRPRFGLIGTDLKENFDYVTAQVGRSVLLQCHFCGEEKNAVPKIWYYSAREAGPDLSSSREVELGMHDNEEKNHFSQRPDYSLLINRVSPSDTGYYYCHGPKGEDAEYKINFMIDVINGTAGIVLGDREDWKNYKSQTYPNLKNKIAGIKMFAKPSNGRKHEFYFHPIPEWTPWGGCDGCIGLRSKMAECKLVPMPASNLKIKLESRKMATTPTTATTTTVPPGNHTKLSYLLFEYGVACQSLELNEAVPHISGVTKEIKPFVLIEPCLAECSHKRRSNQPKFKNTITLQEGDHITLVCPESTLNSAVEWRKDGLRLSKHAATDDADHILVDAFSNLYITYARDVESGSYSCYVNGDKIQEVTVSVNAESVRKQADFLRHIRYVGFMLMFGVIFYIAGVIVAWTQRHSFKTIDFEEMEKEEIEENNLLRRCKKAKTHGQKELAISRKLEEKFVHI